jgi:DNA-binding MarR family transcriptional regulator
MSNLANNATIDALNLWCKILTRSTHETDYELSPRQSLVLLHVYLCTPPHSVKSLSEKLDIPKAAICRALDYLSAHGLIKRKRDVKDKRNVLVQRSINGLVYLSELASIIQQETKQSNMHQTEAA